MGNNKKTQLSKDWIIRSFSSELSDHERKQLVEWLESDPENLAGYLRLKTIWDESAQLQVNNKKDFEQSWNRFRNTIRHAKHPNRTRRLVVFRIAASVALVAGLTATLLWLVPAKQEELAVAKEIATDQSYIITANGEKVIIADEQTEVRYDSLAASRNAGIAEGQPLADPQMLELVVPRSRRITLVLADGSKVWLNSESRLRYPEYFVGNTRSVSLEGEAFFDVTRSEGKSFVVETRKISVEVYGTTFNVTAYADEEQISATLVEGSVAVRENGALDTRMLKPSQRAVYSVENKTFTVGDTDTELYTSWIHGYLKFSSESLQQVIQKLTRSYGISMEINDPVLREHKFSGKLFLQESAIDVLKVIQLAAPMDYREENGKIIILNKNE